MIEPKKITLAFFVSGVLLAGLLWFADFNLPRLEAFDTRWFIAAVLTYVVLIMLRAASLRSLSAEGSGPTSPLWIRLAARHQALFLVAPSGTGDIGFPFMASRYAQIPASEAVRIIAQYRLRDALILALAGVCAAVIQGFSAPIGIAVLVVGAPLILFTDDLSVALFSLLRRVAFLESVTAFLEAAIPQNRPVISQRIARSVLALASWATACLGLKIVFLSLGLQISFAGVLTIIVALNITGAVAVSVAGFGVAEAGLAGALLALGIPPAEAAATAIVARPLLLIAMLFGCAIAEGIATLLLRLSPLAGATQ